MRRHHLVHQDSESCVGFGAHQNEAGVLLAAAYAIRPGERPPDRADLRRGALGSRGAYMLGNSKRSRDGQVDVGVYI